MHEERQSFDNPCSPKGSRDVGKQTELTREEDITVKSTVSEGTCSLHQRRWAGDRPRRGNPIPAQKEFTKGTQEGISGVELIFEQFSADGRHLGLLKSSSSSPDLRVESSERKEVGSPIHKASFGKEEREGEKDDHAL